MLFERPSEVPSFNRYVLPGVAYKTNQRSLLFRYPQQCVTGPVGQQSPFVNGNNGVLKLRAFLCREQKRFDCLHAAFRDLALERLHRFGGRSQENVTLAGGIHSGVKLFKRSGFSGAGHATLEDTFLVLTGTDSSRTDLSRTDSGRGPIAA